MSATLILVPRENVNDESATLVAWEVPDGSLVESGAKVAQIETSKAVVDVLAPASGVLRHGAKPGQDVPIGAPIGRIGEEVAASNGSASHPPTNGSSLPLAPSVRRLVAEGGVDPSQVAGTGRGGRITKGDVVAFLTASPAADDPAPRSTRFSRPARERLKALGLDESRFEGRGLIRARDLEDLEIAGGPGIPPTLTLPRKGGGDQTGGEDQIAAAGPVPESLPLPPSPLAVEGRGGGYRGTLDDSDCVSGSAMRPPTLTLPRKGGGDPTGGGDRMAAAVKTSHPTPKTIAASGVNVRSEPLSRAKRTEAKYLRSGLEGTLASVVTVACPTRGFRQVFGADATPLIVFEVARLLRKYPAFNAYHDEGSACYYDEVNVGFAVDAGRGLKVPIVKGADSKGVAAIGLEMRDLVVDYLEDALPVEALSGGTFTLTDLSGEGVTAFHPLINRGQSAILGICAESFPGGGREGTFNLVLAFDHQLAEGRSAAQFLGDLRDRLMSHESSASKPVGGPSEAEEPRCSRCQASYSTLARDGHPLVQTVRGDGSTRLLCKLCFEGWT